MGHFHCGFWDKEFTANILTLKRRQRVCLKEKLLIFFKSFSTFGCILVLDVVGNNRTFWRAGISQFDWHGSRVKTTCLESTPSHHFQGSHLTFTVFGDIIFQPKVWSRRVRGLWGKGQLSVPTQHNGNRSCRFSGPLWLYNSFSQLTLHGGLDSQKT